MPCFWKRLNIFRVGRLAKEILFLYKKSIKIIKNTLKIEEKFSDVQKTFRVVPKKEVLVGFPETRQCFLLA